MLTNKKRGASTVVLVIIILIGVALIVGAVGLSMMQKGKVNPYAETPIETEVNVVNTIDTVPIPRGFYYVGGTKTTGLVISDNMADKDRGENHEVAKTLVGNQYVWIPVTDIKDFKRKISNRFGIEGVNENIIDTFDTAYGINLWEISQNTETSEIIKAMTDATFAEAKELYASVAKYGGFYIARFEAGLVSPRVEETNVTTGVTEYKKLSGDDIKIKAGTYPCNYLSFSDGYEFTNESNGVVDIARSVYPKSNTNVGVVSTLVYGVEWDATVSFCSGAKNTYGNFASSTFPFIGKYLTDEKTNTYSTDNISSDKDGKTVALYTAGATSYTKVNNIYDMAGSLSEWTMEGMTMITDSSISYARITRGGNFKDQSGNMSDRSSKIQTYNSIDTGFRTALYIK